MILLSKFAAINFIYILFLLPLLKREEMFSGESVYSSLSAGLLFTRQETHADSMQNRTMPQSI